MVVDRGVVSPQVSLSRENDAKERNPIPKETLISAPFPDAQIDRDGRIRVIVLEPVVTNLVVFERDANISTLL